MTLQLQVSRVYSTLTGLRGWRAAWSWSFLTVIVLRLSLGVVIGVVWLAVHPYLPSIMIRVDPTLTGGRTYGLLAEATLGVWPRWDALLYLTLARVGYFGVGQGDSIFYPLYPALVSVVVPFTRGDYVAAGLIVTTLAAMVVFAMLYYLGEQTFGPDSARYSVLAMAVYPTAFFLLAPFTEAVFIALTLSTFVAAKMRRWWLAGLFGALASLARGPGPLTAAAIAWVAWKQRSEWRAMLFRYRMPSPAVLVGVLMPVAGGVGFALWRALAGFPALDSTLSYYSRVEFIDPLRGLLFGLVEFFRVHDLATTLNLASALLFLGVLIAMLINSRWRVGEWIIYVALNLVLFLSKRSLVGSSLQSLGRYVLALFPAFLVAGDWLSRRGPRTRFIYVVASSLGLFFLAVCFALWWFIG